MSRNIQFTETMKGRLFHCEKKTSLPLNNRDYDVDQVKADEAEFTLTIKIDDIDTFALDEKLTAKAVGIIKISNKSYQVENGIFNLFTNPSSSTDRRTAKEMHYTLYYIDDTHGPCTLYGFKTISRENPTKIWEETTTLHTMIWKGHSSFTTKIEKEVIAIGKLFISIEDFISQVTTFKTNAKCFTENISIMTKFLNLFSENIWEAYAPLMFGTDSKRWNDHPVPLRTLDGVRNCKKETVGINTDDGIYIEAKRFLKNETKDVVLLLHGLTTSSDMFIMPEHYNTVQYLHDHGIGDIWALDWRGSNHYTYNLEPHRYSVDHIAKYDIPAVIQSIKNRVGNDVRIHVIAHCVGSLGFFCALAAGKCTNIASVISNCVSLTPRVHKMSFLKLMFAPNFVEYILGYPYLSPKIPYFPGPGFGKWLYNLFIRPFHWECHEPSCHTISFMWGSGHPAAYKHENLSPVTHRRLADLFGGTSVNYYRHIFKMIKNKSALPYKNKEIDSSLPDNYLNNMKNINIPPIFLVEGKENHIFPHSNFATYNELKKIVPDAPISYHEFKKYGHQDIFIGKNCSEDILPTLMKFLNQHIRKEL